jgi:hypothetical protein
MIIMTVLGALAILEADVLECKKRNIDTSEMREALEFFEPVIRPQRLIPQYRNNLPCRNTICISRALRELLQEERNARPSRIQTPFLILNKLPKLTM